jgi:hypothetical protein
LHLLFIGSKFCLNRLIIITFNRDHMIMFTRRNCTSSFDYFMVLSPLFKFVHFLLRFQYLLWILRTNLGNRRWFLWFFL